MPSDSSMEAWFQMGQTAQTTAEQFTRFAEMTKRLTALQEDVNRISRMNEYVIEEMDL